MSVTGQLRGSANYIWSPSDVIGRGATGEVYKCRSKRNGDVFAVKTFNNYSYMRPRDVQQRELAVIQKLAHPNIVKTICVEEEINTGQQVIIMEYCDGGSVYGVLDEPEFMYGLPEDEFLVLLMHIAAGLEYLKSKQVVHRDIKPGNILRIIKEDKTYIYKLSDFGAARELQHEEENFMSMHGTEEYLDPTVYERAVMGQGHGRVFDASVDLWSLGVTLYHIAVGQLPFRPFGGRKNKDTMFEIHNKKDPGVISGVQEKEGGPIVWSRDLPSTCLFSQGLRNLITPVIAGLLEVNPQRKWSYEHFFQEVKSVTSKLILHVFHTGACASLRIYANPEDTLSRVKEMIAIQTNIPSSNQHLVYQHREVAEIVASTQAVKDYTFKTSVDSPIILYFQNAITEFRKATFFEIPRFPRFGTVFSLDNDAPLAKQCAALMFLIGRHVVTYNRSQTLLQEAVFAYSWLVTSMLKRMHELFDAMGNPLLQAKARIRHFKESYERERRLVALMFKGRYKAPKAMVDFFQKTDAEMTKLEKHGNEVCRLYDDVGQSCREYYHRLVVKDELTLSWTRDLGCADKCNSKLLKIIESVDQTRIDFKRDKQLKRLTYNEEQIHKVLKNTMNTNCSTGVNLAQSQCYAKLKGMFQCFSAWFRKAHQVRLRQHKMAENITVLTDQQKKLAASLQEKHNSHSQNMTQLVDQLETGRVAIGPNQLTVHEIPDATPAQTVVQEETQGSSAFHPLQLLEQINQLQTMTKEIGDMGEENERLIGMLQSMTNHTALTENGGLTELEAASGS